MDDHHTTSFSFVSLEAIEIDFFFIFAFFIARLHNVRDAMFFLPIATTAIDRLAREKKKGTTQS